MLSVCVLGSVEVSLGGRPVNLRGRKQIALLTFLAATAPTRHSREKLATLLWGSHPEENARQSLRQALKELRASLPAEAILAADDTLALSTDFVSSDVREFAQLALSDTADALTRAGNLYRGPLASDLSVNEEEWDEWLQRERKRLRDLALDVLVRAADHYLKERNYPAAIAAARRAIALDEYREDAYRIAIIAAAAGGRRADALRLYDQLRDLLARELDVEPDASTQQLVTELQKAGAAGFASAAGDIEAPQGAAPPGAIHLPDANPAPQAGEDDRRYEVAATLPSASQLDVPSIAVLPFELPDGDPMDRYLAHGIIEDIVVSLGSLRDLAVIARGATLHWSGALQDTRVIGRLLGVRYVLRGTLRRQPGRLRVTVELRETDEGDCIWADRMDIGQTEIFDVQDAIVERSAAGIAPSIRAAELRRALRKRPENLSAYDLTLRGMHGLEGLKRETFDEAGALLHRAIAEDPAFSVPVAWASQWHSLAVGQNWSATPDVDADRAGLLAQRSVQLDPRNALGLVFSGHHRAYHQRDPEAALHFYENALSVCPNQALAWTLKSASLSYLGRGAEALEAAERGFMLWPSGPERFYFEFFVGLAHYACGNLAEAVRWSRLSVADNPGFTSAHKALIAGLSGLGQREEAAKVAAQMMALEPGFRLDRYEAERVPIVDETLRRRLIDDLRAAGLPR